MSDWWNVHLTAGLRYDSGKYLSDSFSQWSPRVSLVKPIDENWTVKGSYSSALRAPSLKEYLLNDESKQTIKHEALNPDNILSRLPEQLLAETINSTELSLSYQNSDVIVKLNTYYNRTDNLLGGIPVTFLNSEGQLIAVNSFTNSEKKYSVYGGEVELQWRISNNWHMNSFISNSWPNSKSKEATEDIPMLKANISVTGSLQWFTVNFMQYYQGNISGNVDDIARFDMTFSRQYLFNNFSSFIKVTNVFDQQSYHAVGGLIGNPLPGRSFEFGISYRF